MSRGQVQERTRRHGQWSQHRHNGLLFRPQHMGAELSTNILEVFRVHREDPLTASLLSSLVQRSNFTSTYTMHRHPFSIVS